MEDVEESQQVQREKEVKAEKRQNTDAENLGMVSNKVKLCRYVSVARSQFVCMERG